MQIYEYILVYVSSNIARCFTKLNLAFYILFYTTGNQNVLQLINLAKKTYKA